MDMNPNKPALQSLDPQSVMAQMHIPPSMQQPFQKIVLAGLKVMFDQSTHQLAMKAIDGPGPIEQRVGQGVARLCVMLFTESQGAIPPQLLIPTGIVLVSHAADFLQKSGQPMTPQQVGNANEILVNTLMQAFKIDPAKVHQIAGAYAEQASKGDPAKPAGGPPVPDEDTDPETTPAAPAAPTPPTGGGMLA